MRRITLSKEIEEAHRNYFEKNVKSKLEQEIKSNALKNILKKYKGKFADKLIIDNKLFLKYLKLKSNELAIGRMSELKKINTEIKENYNFIYELLRRNKCELKTIYSQYLLKIFKYDSFVNADFIDYLINICPEMRNDKNGRIKYTAIRDKLIEFSPENEGTIKEKMKGITNKDKLKEVFCELERIFPIYFNIENHTNVNLEKYWNGYKLLFNSGIRVCPYCNRQYITPILTPSGKLRAEFDHYLPKNRFPYFSLSLYNLIPSCSSCNSSLKGTNEFGFDDINPYEDNFDDYAKFHAEINLSRPTKIKLLKTDKINKDIDKIKDMFKLEAQYSYHVNQVDELAKKRISYPEEYIKKLYDKYKKYFRSEEELRELIVGFKIDKDGINEEPLAKFKRDIAKQLYFFKEDDDSHDSKEELIERLRSKYINKL